ncbi:MAG: hypothetical protein KME12_01315 [Trichocoleus desertorum ATA4-8-CV12]|nr:hypothetical protein [Trichocoleus desertorum ATA4-8-CV12]
MPQLNSGFARLTPIAQTAIASFHRRGFGCCLADAISLFTQFLERWMGAAWRSLQCHEQFHELLWTCNHLANSTPTLTKID